MSARVSRTVPITNKRGLHARASSKFAVLAGTFAGVKVQVEREDQIVDGDSIMDLMMLAAGIGSDVTIHTEGTEAEAALDALCALVLDKFGEEE
jgi:phosphocarrier protein HPr